MKLIDKDDIQTIAEETIINNSMNTAKAIPAEYIPITLTTGGRFGVPKVIYIKNFSIEVYQKKYFNYEIQLKFYRILYGILTILSV